jgi:hypothetical protein
LEGRGIVSAEPGAVRVGEFGKERKRGKVKMTGDVLTTTRDSECVEKKGETKMKQERLDSCAILTRYCMWARVIVRRKARGVEKGKGRARE